MSANLYNYISGLLARNRLATAEGFTLRRVSGLAGLEEVVADVATSNIVAVDMTTDGNIHESRGGGFFAKRVHTVFILKRWKYPDMESLDNALKSCRRLMNQMISEMLTSRRAGRGEMTYLNESSIVWREMSPDISTHLTGLYFMLEFDEPTDITYSDDDWSD